MEKSILIIIPSFGIGGILSSLKAMLSLIDTRLVKVDVFAIYKVGPNIQSIPNATVLQESIWLSASIKERCFIVRITQLFLRFVKEFLRLFRLDISPLYIRIGANKLHSEQYDCVISYSEEITRFVSRFPAKKKIAWTHSIYSRFKSVVGRDELEDFKRFDNIVCVSEYSKQDFISVYGILRDRVRVIYNCCNEQKLRDLAQSYTPAELAERRDAGKFIIVSVGRLDPVKQFSSIPQIAKDIKSLVGDCFEWDIIGGICGNGEEEKRIKDGIDKNQVGDVVHLLGMIDNPYPYIANADVLVHTSSSETFGMVIQEALVLGTPAVINDFGAASETVKNGCNGLIVPLNQIASVIVRMIKDSAYYQRLKNNATDSVLKERILHAEALENLVELI